MAADDAKPADAPDEVTIEIFGSREDANLALALLEANSITGRIAADDCAGMLPSLSQARGVRLMVPAIKAEAARELLNLPESDREFVRPSSSPSFSRISIKQIVFGIALGALAMWVSLRPLPARTSGPRTTHYHYADNGVMDEEWLYKDGRLSCHMTDRNLDGSFDHWAYYDADGNMTRSEEDNNFDGKPDEFWKYSNNDLVSMEKDSDFNGVPDEIVTYKSHIPQQLDIKPNGSKFTTIRELYSNGITTEVWSGGDSNGNFQQVVKYDPLFQPISTNILIHPLLSVP